MPGNSVDHYQLRPPVRVRERWRLMLHARACSKHSNCLPQLHITSRTDLFMAAWGGGCWGFYLLVNWLRSLPEHGHLKVSFQKEMNWLQLQRYFMYSLSNAKYLHCISTGNNTEGCHLLQPLTPFYTRRFHQQFLVQHEKPAIRVKPIYMIQGQLL